MIAPIQPEGRFPPNAGAVALGRRPAHAPGEQHYLVAYDIADPKRLRRVARTCEDYGIRVQKSVFECDLAMPRFQELWSKLVKVADLDEDYLAAYPMCSACLAKAVVAGRMDRPQRSGVYVC